MYVDSVLYVLVGHPEAHVAHFVISMLGFGLLCHVSFLCFPHPLPLLVAFSLWWWPSFHCQHCCVMHIEGGPSHSFLSSTHVCRFPSCIEFILVYMCVSNGGSLWEPPFTWPHMSHTVSVSQPQSTTQIVTHFFRLDNYASK